MTGQVNGSQVKEHIWLVALYEGEARANELLDRLGALGIDTSEATVLRVEIDDAQTTLKPVEESRPMSPIARSAVTGAMIGSATVLLLGIFLYSLDIIMIKALGGLFNHAILSVVIGALTGAVIGAILATTGPRVRHNVPLHKINRLKSEGFLVAVKMAPSLAERAEEIARSLGAKQILL